MAHLSPKETIEMLGKLLRGEEVRAITGTEKEVKAALLRDIAYAKKKGYQIEIPNE